MSNLLGASAKNKNQQLHSKPLQLAAILGTLAAFAPLSIDMYLPALPFIAEELNTTQSFVQLSLTFFLFGLVLGQLLVGPLSDSLGRRKPLLIGLVIYTIASLLCVVSPSIEAFIGLRFIQGLSGASGIVLSRAIVRDLFAGKELTKFFALLALIQGIAPVLAPVLGGIVLLFAPWKGVFIFLTAIGIAMFFIVLFYLPDSLDEGLRTKGSVKSTLTTFKQLFVDRSFIGFALSLAFIHSMMFAYISGSSFVLQNKYEVSAQLYSFIFAMNGIGIAVLAQITGRLVGRLQETTLLKIGIGMAFVGSASLFILLAFDAKLIFILPVLLLAISSMGVVSTTGQSLALQNQGKVAGSASALLGVLQYTLSGTIAPLTGLGSNPAIAMGLVMTIQAIGAILAYLFLVRLTPLKIQQDAQSESM
jgi:DHA1 family bicyclomycin/chloramphenicol resistance-like MFS transporter